MVIVIATGEGPLGAALAGHGEGFRVEQLAPLFFGFFHALDHYPALPGRLARLYTRPRLPFGSAAVFWYFMPPLPPPLMRPQPLHHYGELTDEESSADRRPGAGQPPGNACPCRRRRRGSGSREGGNLSGMPRHSELHQRLSDLSRTQARRAARRPDLCRAAGLPQRRAPAPDHVGAG